MPGTRDKGMGGSGFDDRDVEIASVIA